MRCRWSSGGRRIRVENDGIDDETVVIDAT